MASRENQIKGYGFFHAPNAVMDDENLSPNEKLTMMYLCRAANADGMSYWSYQGMSIKTGLSRSTVIRCVRKLIQEGYISIEKRIDESGNHKSNLYSLIPIHEKKKKRGVVSQGNQGGVTGEPGWCHRGTRVVSQIHPKDYPLKDYPIKGKKREKRTRAKILFPIG